MIRPTATWRLDRSSALPSPWLSMPCAMTCKVTTQVDTQASKAQPSTRMAARAKASRVAHVAKALPGDG